MCRAILAAHAAFQGQDQLIAAQCLKSGQGWVHSTSTGVKKSPKDFPTPPAITACLSMRAAGLVPNTVHKGRVLRGTVASHELLVTNNITLLLRDERGDLVSVSLCGGASRNDLGRHEFCSASCVTAGSIAPILTSPFNKETCGALSTVYWSFVDVWMHETQETCCILSWMDVLLL